MFLTADDSLLDCTPKKRRRSCVRPYNIATIHLTTRIRLQELKRERLIERHRLIEQCFVDYVPSVESPPIVSNVEDWYIYHCYLPHDSTLLQNLFTADQRKTLLDRIINRKEQFRLFINYLLNDSFSLNTAKDFAEFTQPHSSHKVVTQLVKHLPLQSDKSSPIARNASKIYKKRKKTSPKDEYDLQEEAKSDSSSKTSTEDLSETPSIHQALLYVLTHEPLLLKIIEDLENVQTLDVDTWERKRIATGLRKMWWTLTKPTTSFKESIHFIEELLENMQDILIECKRCRRYYTHQKIQSCLISLDLPMHSCTD